MTAKTQTLVAWGGLLVYLVIFTTLIGYGSTLGDYGPVMVGFLIGLLIAGIVAGIALFVWGLIAVFMWVDGK